MFEYLLGHVIMDFYLKDESKDGWLEVLKYRFLYGVVLFGIYMIRRLFFHPYIEEIYLVGLMIVLVGVIDLIRVYIEKLYEKYASYIILGSQLISICIISVLSLYMGYNNNLMMYICTLVLLSKPANVFVKTVTRAFDPKNENDVDVGFEGAGERIGTLERVLMLLILVLSNGNFTGIAIVLTLKTVARYKKISDDAKFAEYFVIGSLTSLLIVIIMYLLSLAINISYF